MLAFGYKNLVIDNTCADIFNSKTINAARDAIFKLNIQKDEKRDWLVENKKALPIYVTDSIEGVSLDNFQPEKKFILVFGSESHGVSEVIKKLANKKIKINISKDIESLNVATAAAIMLYKLR